MKREKATILAVSLISLVAGFVLFRFTYYQPAFSSAEQTTHGNPGTVVPALTHSQIQLKDLNDQMRHLSEWEKPLQVINLWAPWCAPCRREMPSLMELQQQYNQQVQFIGLSFDSKANVKAFKESLNINYPLLLVGKESAQINQYFGNQSGGLPFTAILNANREIVYHHAGEISKHELETKIVNLL